MSFNFFGSGKQTERKKDDLSLDDILQTTAQKQDLILLVVLLTDALRTQFINAFRGHDQNRERKAQSAENPRSNIIYGEQLSEAESLLKASGVAYFNEWRTRLLRRMGETLSIRPEVVQCAKADYLASRQNPSTVDSVTYGLPSGLQKYDTSVLEFDQEKRAIVLNSCLFLLMSLESYPAQSRILLQYLCACLNLPIKHVTNFENTLAMSMLETASKADMNADDARQKKADEGALGRRWKVGLATVGGAALIGISGGLLAPVVLAAAGSVFGAFGLGGLAALLGTAINPVTVAIVFGGYGGRMSGNAMEKYAKEVKDFKFVPLNENGPKSQTKSDNPDPASNKLRVAIGISGWLLDEPDVYLPWDTVSGQALEVYALQYERTALLELGHGLIDLLKSSAYSFAQGAAISFVLPAVSAALAPLGMLRLGRVLDNSFTVAMERSDKAGKVLAAALIAKVQGERPVTLLGYSLGARVIYSCLQELAAKKAFGLIESVVMAGAPTPAGDEAWRRMRAVVSGRIVNVYTTHDLLLSYLYRTRNVQLDISGLQAIEGVQGVESIDVSTFVAGHNQYRLAIGKILKEINFQDLDLAAVEKAEKELEAEDAKEKEIHHKAQEAGELKDVEDEDGKIIMFDAHQVEMEEKLEKPESDLKSKTDQESINRSLEKLDIRNSSTRGSTLKQSAGPDDEYEHIETDEEDDARHMIHMDPATESESELEPKIIQRKSKV